MVAEARPCVRLKASYTRRMEGPVNEAVTELTKLLLPDARSELRAEFREKQCGGGWVQRKS